MNDITKFYLTSSGAIAELGDEIARTHQIRTLGIPLNHFSHSNEEASVRTSPTQTR
ncbi:MAG: hypothetical protein KBT82_08880 [Marinobacter sp.]|uniref:hypothetical protein n=1 Tax=Marinobacter sp. TaxID=50741 RepID=UPI001B53C562|nr:hypothetical protein [Marinobacter sp.]MBQ0814275.1 hypothetical protein [Marinobacter sp.]